MTIVVDGVTDEPVRVTRTRRRVYGWPVYLLGLLAFAWIATQLFYFVQIGIWTVVDPSDTAFMRAARWRFWHEGQSITFQHQWVPYDGISRNLKRAIIASEDANFVNNKGYEVDSILQAWEKNKKKGQMAAGGSTITQQLARNLFLATEKTYIRKGQELIITLMLEFWMDKERIFEIYLNSVEWGKGVYGAQAAAAHYYKVDASKLSVGQSARLAVMLPRPKYFDDHRGGPYLTSRAAVIARRMGAAELPSDK
ncbi:MAG TPA: monofunctional biosynthetic peptidoglycan transglycosylase [Pararobbsia sp.]|jgi:monofunctional biosynthetic peptidoglycan transglycosylase|nr:monofunctional biosynthetic peptidoglycan transglycosylase [Pararobbsia sp.]